MNRDQIEALKFEVTNLAKFSKTIRISEYGIEGRVVGVGFKPYWTYIYDSRMDKLELNVIDKTGRIIPVRLNYVIGYDKTGESSNIKDSEGKERFELHVYSPEKSRDKEPYDKIRMEIVGECE